MYKIFSPQDFDSAGKDDGGIVDESEEARSGGS